MKKSFTSRTTMAKKDLAKREIMVFRDCVASSSDRSLPARKRFVDYVIREPFFLTRLTSTNSANACLACQDMNA